MKKLLIIFLILSFLSSCVYEEIIKKTPPPTVEISVLTRSSSMEEIPIVLPVHVYAFASNGKCAAYRMLSEQGENLSLTLPIGNYTFYALTGASADRYIIPDSSVAAPSSVLTLIDSSTGHAELETGRADVMLEDVGYAEVVITVTRAVAQIKASISGLPDNVSGVRMSFNPVKTLLRLDGTFNNNPEKKEVAFSLAKTGGTEWHTVDSIYVFPSESNVTIGIALTGEDGNERRHSYNAPLEINANHKYEIAASYKSGNLDLSGIISGTDWAGTIQHSFEFGDGAGESVDPVSPVLPLYAPNEFYKDCYILDVEEHTEDSVMLTLISPRKWHVVRLLEDADLIGDTIHTNGIRNWKVINADEAHILNVVCTDDLEAINARMPANSGFTKELPYACKNHDGTFHEFPIQGVFSTRPINVTSNTKEYYVRYTKKLPVYGRCAP